MNEDNKDNEKRTLSMGEKLRLLREERGLSQVKLAEMSGVKNNTISQIEHGLTVSSRTVTINALAAALGVNPIYFSEDNITIPFDLEQLTSVPGLREAILKKDILKKEFMPFLAVSEKAFREGISADLLKKFVEFLIKKQ